MKLTGFIVLICLKIAYSAPAEDLITHLPGLSATPSYKQYSGYLTASANKHFHYWFVESQNDPINDPVVLWLNGGPGCSSLDGLLSENGPVHVPFDFFVFEGFMQVNDDGETLYINPFSWNRIANVLYLESPAGVGYSYDDNGIIKTDDDEVSQNNYNALVDFFKKFSEYRLNKFFISGESYGGVYIPTLANRILQGSFKLNFVGISIGNGVSDETLNFNSAIFFAYYHGIYGETIRKSLSQFCCNGGWSRSECDFKNTKEDLCLNYTSHAMDLVSDIGLNQYALYRDCEDINKGSSSQRYRVDIQMLYRHLDPTNLRLLNHKLTTTRRVGTPVLPCINATASISWSNRGDVREALHIKSNLKEWSVCSQQVLSEYGKIYRNLTSQYQKIFHDSSLRVLMYNGDTDMVCNFLGVEWFVDDLNRPITKARVPWYVKGQVAGFVKTFDRITYTTIRGAGHMVPQWAPEYAFVLFEKFLDNKPFNTK